MSASRGADDTIVPRVTALLEFSAAKGVDRFGQRDRQTAAGDFKSLCQIR